MSDKPLLLVEDTPSLQMVYASVLRNAGYDVETAGTGADGVQAFKQIQSDVVLLDLMLPDIDGLEVMRQCLAAHPTARFIVITANGSINRAVEAMRSGAFDFLVKPFDEQRFLNAVSNALKTVGQAPPATPPGAEPRTIPGFIGSSAIMRDVYDMIDNVSRSMATVFISGESGTGKEVCAQAVHQNSTRSGGPFVALNCGAIPSDLLESEVFGHLKGSFTGAIADKPGAAAQADRGTLFLDEICEMDLNLQTKLLRFLQTSTITPVGSTRPKKIDARIVCATNRDPMAEVKAGRFREDLYYRLHVVPIHLPPLRDRGTDVLEIADGMLKEVAEEEGRKFTGFDADVEQIFLRYNWPGNVRQLLNVLRNVVVLNDGPLVTRSMLPLELTVPNQAPGRAPIAAATEDRGSLNGLIGLSLAEIEKIVIEETIAREGGSIPRAARVLDVSPSTIYRKRDSWSSVEP